MSEEKQEALPEGVDEGVRAELGRLRDLTRRTGAIHDAQLLQLKVWPRIMFPIIKHTIEYDSEQRILVIVMKLSEALVEGDELKKRIRLLEGWCWALLGPEWSIRLRTRLAKGGRSKEIHKGRRKVGLSQPAKISPVDGIEAINAFKRYGKLDIKKAQESLEELTPILERK